ncbi:MAG: hypothetical protein C4522_09485 [Desulfobacteraceae bacterium]|nr:MAG: hypothetical protein C4522_09485 [Desulfobacteraceae bacterium]
MELKYKLRHPIRWLLTLLPFFVFIVVLSTIRSYADDTSRAGINSIEEAPAREQKFQEWAFFPVIASNAQTGLQLGALAIRFIEASHPDNRTSTIDFIAFGTTEGQYYAKIGPDLYFSNDKYHLNTELSGGFWPLNFYGIGSDTPEENETPYESTEYRIKVTLERKILKHTYAGVVGHYEDSDIEFEDPNTNAITNRSVGTGGRTKSGMGCTLSFDNRDNVNDARNGTFIHLESLFFEKSLGSDHTFQVYHLDLNHYRAITAYTGIAFRGYLQAARGEIPFQDFSSPDGSQLLRGIEDGRYRDRDLIGFQSEFRYPIYQKWRGTFFAETAQVAEEFSDLESNDWKYSIGGGLRYALNPSERFNIRLDLSYVDSGFGLVLNIREAF